MNSMVLNRPQSNMHTGSSIGLSHDSETMINQNYDILKHYLIPLTRKKDTVEEKFKELLIKWKAETLFSSSITQIINNDSYLEIIKMGKKIVPFILRELEKEPNHLFFALRMITNEDPISDEDRGDLEKMAKAWVRWGKERGLN